jgi:hypothetical protein
VGCKNKQKYVLHSWMLNFEIDNVLVSFKKNLTIPTNITPHQYYKYQPGIQMSNFGTTDVSFV